MDQRIKQTSKGGFRARLYAEDIMQEHLDVGYAKVFIQPIRIYSTYDNSILYFSNMNGKEAYNPAKIGGKYAREATDRSITRVFISLLDINPNIDKNGSKKLIGFTINRYFNKEDLYWTFEKLFDRFVVFKRDYDNGRYNGYIEKNHPEDVIDRHVIYSETCGFTREERMYMTRRLTQDVKDKQYSEEIDSIIRSLVTNEKFTKITVARIARYSDTSEARVNRIITSVHKREIEKANEGRPFTKEEMGVKFSRFHNSLDIFEDKSIKEICEILNIGNTTFYQFKKLSKYLQLEEVIVSHEQETEPPIGM